MEQAKVDEARLEDYARILAPVITEKSSVMQGADGGELRQGVQCPELRRVGQIDHARLDDMVPAGIVQVQVDGGFEAFGSDLAVPVGDGEHFVPVHLYRAGLMGVDMAGVGGEYAFTENWSFQLGLTHDYDPTDAAHSNTMCPPGDRDQIGVGLTYAKDDWAVSFDYMYVDIHETERVIHGVETKVSEARTDTVGLTFSKMF